MIGNGGAARRAVSLLAAGLVLAALSPSIGWASPTEVVHARFERSGGGWRVSVTLRHADTGWNHYANLWVVETSGGRELGRRVIFHPHVDEQPFTRSQQIAIPAGITKVRVRAGDNRNGIASNTLHVDLTQSRGKGYEVL